MNGRSRGVRGYLKGLGIKPGALQRAATRIGTAKNLGRFKLQEWENFYNYNRPHGGLNGQTPYERLKQKTEARK